MTAKRFIPAILILALCTGAQAQDAYEADFATEADFAHQADFDAQIKITEAVVRLAEAHAHSAEVWANSSRISDAYSRRMERESAERRAASRERGIVLWGGDSLAYDASSSAHNSRLMEMERAAYGEATGPEFMRKVTVVMARQSAEAMAARAQAMDEQAQSHRQLAGLSTGEYFRESARKVERMAMNFDQAAALYRKAQMEYSTLSRELDDME